MCVGNDRKREAEITIKYLLPAKMSEEPYLFLCIHLNVYLNVYINIITKIAISGDFPSLDARVYLHNFYQTLFLRIKPLQDGLNKTP